VKPSELDQIVRSVKKGESDLYGQLVFNFQQQIFKYCFHMLGQLQEAEDVTQDIFLKGLERLDQYQEGTSFSAWLYKIAYHECLNRINRAKTYKRLLRILSWSTTAVQAETSIPKLQFNQELHGAMLQLNLKDRHIIWLRIVEENRFEDIAIQMNMSYAAVRKRYERAKDKLRRTIAIKEDDKDGRSFSY